MEDSQAAFIGMVMDRLQAVEAQLQDMKHLNEKLGSELSSTRDEVGQLKGALRLKHGLTRFTDGWELCPGFAWKPDTMEDPTGAIKMLLDNLHLDAICCFGAMEISPYNDEVEDDNFILVGEATDQNKMRPITVRELLEGINQWCRKPFKHTTNYHEFLKFDGRAPLLRRIVMSYYNHSTKRWHYTMFF